MKDAKVVDLSPSMRAVLTWTPNGNPASITFVRGREAFILSDREVRKLAAALGGETQ